MPPDARVGFENGVIERSAKQPRGEFSIVARQSTSEGSAVMTTSAPEARTVTAEGADFIVSECRAAFPDLQAVYVFGSRVGGALHDGSDCDIAILLPPATARHAGSLSLSDLHQSLERSLRLEVDLINLRLASTVFAKEVVFGGERIDASDSCAADEFEALTLSLYQELNLERAALLRDFERTGIAFAP